MSSTPALKRKTRHFRVVTDGEKEIRSGETTTSFPKPDRVTKPEDNDDLG